MTSPDLSAHQRSLAGYDALGIFYTVTSFGAVSSLPEAAARTGLATRDVVKSLVVRRSEGDYLFVLVPGDRTISWPKLRDHLGVQRLSMATQEEAQQVTGFVRGTITPFGSLTALPVLADASLLGDEERLVAFGVGAPGMLATTSAEFALAALDADVADVTKPASFSSDGTPPRPARNQAQAQAQA